MTSGRSWGTKTGRGSWDSPSGHPPPPVEEVTERPQAPSQAARFFRIRFPPPGRGRGPGRGPGWGWGRGRDSRELQALERTPFTLLSQAPAAGQECGSLLPRFLQSEAFFFRLHIWEEKGLKIFTVISVL